MDPQVGLDTDVRSWSTETWAWFDQFLDNLIATKGGDNSMSKLLIDRLEYIKTRMDSGGAYCMTHPLLDDVCGKLLTAAMARHKLGWVLLALDRLPETTKHRLDEYEPLTRTSIWLAIDVMLAHPLLTEASVPKDGTTKYNPERRLLTLRVAMSTAQSQKANACCNCGAHVTAYPKDWAEYDEALRLVWCRNCYTPPLISEHRLVRLYKKKPEDLVKFGSISPSGKKRPATTQYLVKQVLDKSDLTAMVEMLNEPVENLYAFLQSPLRGKKRTKEQDDEEADKNNTVDEECFGSPETPCAQTTLLDEDDKVACLSDQEDKQQKKRHARESSLDTPVPEDLRFFFRVSPS